MKVKIIGFGDSITADQHVEDEAKRWLSILKTMLSEKYRSIKFSVFNAGVGGNSDREKMSRYQNDVLERNPDILLVQFGGNNSGYDDPERAVSVREMEEYLQQIKETISSETKIVVITFPHVIWRKHKHYTEDPERFIQFFEKSGGHEARLNQYREVLKAFAIRNDYPIVDLYNGMKEFADMESLQVGDGVHLGAAGDKLLAQLVFRAVAKVINEILKSERE